MSTPELSDGRLDGAAIAFGMVGLAIVPGTPEDAYPGTSEDANGMGVPAAACSRFVVDAGGPGGNVAASRCSTRRTPSRT